MDEDPGTPNGLRPVNVGSVGQSEGALSGHVGTLVRTHLTNDGGRLKRGRLRSLDH